MNIYSLPALLSTIAYAVLIALILRKIRTRLGRILTVYLVVSLVFSFGIYLLISNLFPGQIRLLGLIPSLFGIGITVSYYHFVCIFTHKTGRLAVKIGYAVLAFIIFPLGILGYFPEEVQSVNNGLYIHYGMLLYPLVIFGFIYVALSIFRLIQRHMTLNDPLERSRVLYLFIGLVISTLFNIREGIPPLPTFPLNQVGHFCNALIITYAIMRYQLFNIKLVLKKGFVYIGITTVIAGFFLGLLYFLGGFVSNWSAPATVVSVISLAILLSLSFNRLKRIIEKTVNIIFYGKNYSYRKMVSNFARRMSNVLDLEQLAETMLPPISKALHSDQVSLLLPEDDYFSLSHAVRFFEEEAVVPIRLRNESPIVDWLAREKKVLSRNLIDTAPNFKALWKYDIEAIADAEILFPLISKDRLVGILVLGRRRKGGYYNDDDIDLITTLTSEAAVVIENAELYAQAEQRANIDELTGLYNHRFFHQRIIEEIARASRFGEVYCLLSIDLDFFKSYNDVYGHLYGDEVLRKVGEVIKESSRSIDMAFRYGGDEFSIILPQTTIDGAYKVAERIRKSVESTVDIEGRLMTCSIGIASWPTDGVMREELIRASDTALYYSKHMGRNRTSIASELPISELINKSIVPNNKDAILSTIYALAATVDAKDKYTYGHSKKVSKYATDIAEALGLSKERVDSIRTAALLHDIGKIGVSDQILGKYGPLNDDEWQPIYAHPTMGVSILKHVDSLKDCLAAVQYHHERYDGSGYPAGMKGSNIPLDARIIAIADTYDAMTSSRPYRNMVKTQEEAIEELKRCSGTQFDPDIVQVFVELMTSTKSVKSKDQKMVMTYPQ